MNIYILVLQISILKFTLLKKKKLFFRVKKLKKFLNYLKRTIIIWNLKEKKLIHKFYGHLDNVTCFYLKKTSNIDTSLISYSWDG